MDVNYSILGVKPDAPVDDIKKAFRLHTLNGEGDFDLLANAYKEIIAARENNIQSVVHSCNDNKSIPSTPNINVPSVAF